MKKEDVIVHFGTQEKTALALGVKQSSVSRWENEIPALRAFEIERITNGVLKADFIPPHFHFIRYSIGHLLHYL